MNIHSEIQSLLYDFYRCELDPKEHEKVETHLKTCSKCAEEAPHIENIIEVSCSYNPSSERPNEYWNSFFTRIEQKAETKKRNPFPIFDYFISFLQFHPKHAVIYGGVLILLVASLLTWKFYKPSATENIIQPTSSQPIVLSETDKRIGSYFRKSKTLLTGISNMNLETSNFIDLSAEQKVSKELVHEARSFQHQPLDINSAKLVSDVEKILIELANSKKQNDVPDIELIQNCIHKENLLFKIRMAETMYETPKFVQINNSYEGDRK